MSMFLSIARFAIRAYLGIAMAALAVMMMAIVFDVFMRYTFNSPVAGTFDVVEICLVITVFYSMGAAISGFHEIVIDLVDQIAPPRLVRLLYRFAGLLSLAVLLFVFVSMLTPARQSYQWGEMRLELDMPVWIVWVIALVGMCGGLLGSLVNVLQPQGTGKADPPTTTEAL